MPSTGHWENDMAKCKSCGAEITWTLTTTGKKMPVEHKPRGNIKVITDEDTGTLRAIMLKPGEGDYVSHFSTCPDAPEHRRPKT